MPVSERYQPAPLHSSLGEAFSVPVKAASFPEHQLRFRNQRWAQRLGLESLTADEWLQHFGHFAPLPDNLPEPLALKYHGHQFRHYNPDLGDGRGFLFAQCRDLLNGRLLDLGTKGSGQTPYSRRGDGRLTLKGGVREVLATEMLEALGVETSKTFSLVETGEALWRHDEPSPTRSAVLVRLNHSHVRFGTFQRLAFEQETDSIEALVHYCLKQYFPQLEVGQSPAASMFAEVCRRSASLCASWMAAGFVHGVLNTDNMNITGESFDYGPYRFAPTVKADYTAAYFDHAGLYAYGRQPDAVFWNLQRLGASLLPLLSSEDLKLGLAEYEAALPVELDRFFLQRLGLLPSDSNKNSALVGALLRYLEKSQAGMDQFFFDWYGGVLSRERAQRSPQAKAYEGMEFRMLELLLEEHEVSHPERLQHPYFSRAEPIHLLYDEIETLWKPIVLHNDWSAFDEKVEEIRLLGEVLENLPAKA